MNSIEIAKNSAVLASALLWRWRLLSLGIIILASVAGVIARELIQPSAMLAIALTEVISLVFFWTILKHTISAIKGSSVSPPAITFFAIGLAPWFISSAFTLSTNYVLQKPSFGLALLFLGVVFIYCLTKFYFYFMPLALGTRSIKDIFVKSTVYTKGTNFTGLTILPIITFIVPYTIFVGLTQVAHAIDPDGRQAWTMPLLTLCESIYIPLSVFFSTAAGILATPREYWEEASITPPTIAELTKATNPKWLTTILTPKTALIILLLSFIIGFSTLNRAQQLPASAEVVVEDIEQEAETIWLTLNISDPNYNFRWLTPNKLYLGEKTGKTRDLLQLLPIEYSINDIPNLKISEIPKDTESITLVIAYKILKPRLLDKKESLNLWYGVSPLGTFSISRKDDK